MGMRVAIAIMRSTGNIISTRVFILGLIAALELGACASTPKGPGTLSAPLKELQVSSPFGQRSANRPHYGVDFRADKGTNVFSAADGRVVFAGKQRGFGKLVIIDHGGGVETYYAHLSRIKTKEGKRVDRGDRVGLVGKTGNATGAHLHFEVRIAGRPVDPLLQLSTRPKGT